MHPLTKKFSIFRHFITTIYSIMITLTFNANLLFSQEIDQIIKCKIEIHNISIEQLNDSSESFSYGAKYRYYVTESKLDPSRDDLKKIIIAYNIQFNMIDLSSNSVALDHILEDVLQLLSYSKKFNIYEQYFLVCDNQTSRPLSFEEINDLSLIKSLNIWHSRMEEISYFNSIYEKNKNLIQYILQSTKSTQIHVKLIDFLNKL